MFITGGTGFVGTWLVAALHQADLLLNLDLDVTVLSRTPGRYKMQQPALAEWTTVLEGDVTQLPSLGVFDVAVHAATPADATLIENDPELMRSVMVEGMERVLEALSPSGAIPFLFTSSGAVYGPQPSDLKRLPESFVPLASQEALGNAYAIGKQNAEIIASNVSAAGGPSLKLARLFAFVGPYLPLDRHFAVGNFIGDALAGQTIQVRGDGTAIRSYMYATDMVVALLAVLVRGQERRPYNVGSSSAVTISELAAVVRDVVAPNVRVTLQHTPASGLPANAGNRYVPDTHRITSELGVTDTITLPEAVARTAKWHRSS